MDTTNPAGSGQPVTPSSTVPGLPPLPDRQGTFDAIPGYEVLAELGRGGMGVVYKARQVGLNRLVALKMILGGHAHQAARDRFRVEAEAIARLQHPNIVQIHDVGEHLGQPYFSLEYCPGGSLAEHLHGRPMPPAEAARLLVPLARAVEHAHRAGILHRDLKPGNVLLQTGTTKHTKDAKEDEDNSAPFRVFRVFRGDDLVPKITDFGLAKLLDSDTHTRSGDILGTPAYMPPEQADGKVHLVGPGSDVYSLGAILYETLTGRPPFSAASPLETALEVMLRDPVPVRTLSPKVPRDLETICLKCLRKAPSQRYLSAAELADDLERYLDGRPILARPVGPLERLGRWVKRKPLQAVLALVLLLATLGGLGGWAWFTSRLERERDEADRQRRLAEGRLEKAFGVAERYFTDVSESTLLHEPGMQPVRQKLLQNARALYAGFVEERGDDPKLAKELALSVYRLALLDAELGDLKGAITQLRDAEGRFQALDLPLERGRVLNEVGRLERLRGRLDDAATAYLQAREAWQALPKDRVAKEGLGRCLLGLGNVEVGRKDYARAMGWYEDALVLRQQLVTQDPTNEGYLRDVAITWQNLATAQANLSRRSDARQSHAEAVRVFRQLVEAYPSRARYRDDLAMAVFNDGNRLLFAGEYGPAREQFVEAVERFEFLVFTNPGVPSYAQRLGDALWNLNVCLDSLGEMGEALAVASKSRAIRRRLADANPAVPDYQVALAQTYRLEGDRLAARKDVRQARQAYTRALATLDRVPENVNAKALRSEVQKKIDAVSR